MRDITVMDNPIDKLPPEGGYYAAILLALAGIFKAALPWLRSRDAAHAKLTKEERDAARAEERDLVATLKTALTKHEERIAALEARVDGLITERATLLTDKAELVIKLAHAEDEIGRLRESRDHYRSIAEAGQRVAERAGHASAATQLADEISQADEATSQAGGKP
jgi:chromosome segregation ATPase